MMKFPDSFPSGVIEIFGAVLVALIAGVVSLVGLVISKEQKLSEFRQDWIDSLRREISSLVSDAMMVNAYCHMFMKKINEERRDGKIDEKEYESRLKQFYDDTYKSYLGMNTSSTRIKLRLNHTELEAADLLRKMKALEALFETGPVNLDEHRVPILVDEIEQVSQPLLKNEWNRVKAGEPTYRIAKRTCIWISSLLALILLAMLISIPAFMFGYTSAPRLALEEQKHSVCTSPPSIALPIPSLSIQQQCTPLSGK